MKRLLFLCISTLLVCSTIHAADSVMQCKFRPHFQANVDLKALGTGHMIHKGDFTIVPPYPTLFNLDMPAGGTGFDAVLGCRVKEFFFIGGGFSLQWWFNADSKNQWSFLNDDISASHETFNDEMKRFGMGWAFYAAPRFYIPTKKKDITPYIDLGFGFCQFFMMLDNHGVNQYKMDLYFHGGLGVDIKRFNLSAGYQYSYNSNAYLRVGYRF